MPNKHIYCPHCDQELIISKNFTKEKFIQCASCNNTFKNPFYKKSYHQWIITFIIVGICAFLDFIGSKNDDQISLNKHQQYVIKNMTIGSYTEDVAHLIGKNAAENNKIATLQLVYEGKAEFINANTKVTFLGFVKGSYNSYVYVELENGRTIIVTRNSLSKL